MGYLVPPPPPVSKQHVVYEFVYINSYEAAPVSDERCEYCRRAVTGDVCDHCGAPHEPKQIKSERSVRPKPIETETIIR